MRGAVFACDTVGVMARCFCSEMVANIRRQIRNSAYLGSLAWPWHLAPGVDEGDPWLGVAHVDCASADSQGMNLARLFEVFDPRHCAPMCQRM